MNNDDNIIITQVKPKRTRKKPSELESNDVSELPGASSSVQQMGTPSIAPVSLLSSVPVIPPVQNAIVEAKLRAPRKKSAKTLAKEELIETEKEMKKLQLEREQEMRQKAFEEIQKLETLKSQLLREEIQKQIQSEAQGEIKRTRKTRDSASASVEKKKTTKKVVKDLMPDSIIQPPRIQPQIQNQIVPQIVPQIPSRPSSSFTNIFSQKGGRTFL